MRQAMTAEKTPEALKIRALGIGAQRQRRRIDGLRLELAQRHATRERAEARCGDQRHLLDASEAAVRTQRNSLEQMRTRRFSGEAWLEGLRMLGLLDERRAEQADKLDKLELALRQADAQIDATSRALGAAQARADLLTRHAAMLRKQCAARQLERDDEDASEDAAGRMRRAVAAR
jgi:hypothetical protein